MSDATHGPGQGPGQGRGRDPWHLDKRVPIALIATLVIQTGAAIWWASAKDRDIARAGDDIGGLKLSVAEQAKAIQRLELRSASLEQGNATIIEQNRQLASDVRELTRSMIRLETIMRQPSGAGGNGGRRVEPPPFQP